MPSNRNGRLNRLKPCCSMNLYVIAHKALPHYFVGSHWGDVGKFNWTVDLFFAVFGSDRELIQGYYTRQWCCHPGYLDLYHVREFTDAEYTRLIELQCYHSRFEMPVKRVPQ